MGIALACTAVIVVGGILQRVATSFRLASSPPPAVLKTPLSSLPRYIEDWQGVDVPLSDQVLEIAQVDEYVSRRYRNQNSGDVVDFYLGYSVRPDDMIGHRPRVCYPAHGWSHVETRTIDVPTKDGEEELRCLLHTFERQRPVYSGVVVLNYFVLQGEPTTDSFELWRSKRRHPLQKERVPLYAAQVQISSRHRDPSGRKPAVSCVRRLASAMVSDVFGVLPGPYGEDAAGLRQVRRAVDR